MLIDALNSNNYISYNITLCQVFGLAGAVYCSELLNITKKAELKNKLIDGKYVKVNRKFITDRTLISTDDQLVIDSKWEQCGVIEKCPTNQDLIKLNTTMIMSIIASEEVVLDNLKVKFGFNKEARAVKRELAKDKMKGYITTTSEQLRPCLERWVESIFNKFGGKGISKQSIVIFEKTLTDYTSDVNTQIRIVEIATINGYRDCTWAISQVEKDIKYRNIFGTTSTRVTEQKVEDRESMKKSVEF